ncbi:MAG: carboxypeptidase-like regulatory domain-containing protein [Bacteroidia bacterium]|nr:carboxypeptidase-like regulatory domain-containing protein [Bacteroidia bacterium]
MRYSEFNIKQKVSTVGCLMLLCFSFSAVAQNKKLITGTIVDASNNDPVSFASVSLKKQLIGTVSNDDGQFDFYIPEDLSDDSLLISFFGYKQQAIALNDIKGALNIKLKPSAFQLEEVVIRPMPPEYYIRLAMRKVKFNYADSPFETVAYYREKVLENKQLIALNEGAFKTYYPKYTDTLKNSHQLMLFRKAEKTSEVAFMSKERKKAEEKEKKTGKKEDKNIEMDLGSSFGGPESILQATNLTKKTEGSLDTTELKEYKYSFAKSSSYNNKEIMVIDFTSKGKVDHLRESGKIYLDTKSMAIIRFESSGELVIPVILRPIIFLYGIGIGNPSYVKSIAFQEVNGKWYPQNFQYNIDLKLTNRHWFSPNEHSLFEIEQVFVVNKTKVEQASPIPANKKFDSKKDMPSQVFNDDGLSWEGLNIIKR